MRKHEDPKSFFYPLREWKTTIFLYPLRNGMRMDLDALEQAGLSSREARLYLALLDLGSTTVGPLVDRTEIPSSKIYEVLDRLEEKGLANHIIKGKRKHFQASSPDVILHALETQKDDFEKHLSNLKERQRLARQQQFAEYHEGKEAVFSLVRQLIKQAPRGSTYRSFAVDDELEQGDVAAFVSSTALLRHERRLMSKVLVREEARKLFKEHIPSSSRKVMNIRYTSWRFPDGVIILDNDLILVEWEGEASAVRIRNEAFVRSYREFFDEMYAQAAKK